VTSILFVQLQRYPYPGLYAVCGALRDAGFRYEVLVSTDRTTIADRLRTTRPDVVAFPCMTGLHRAVLRAAALVKGIDPEIKVLLGGIHPTLVPQIVEDANVDFVCRGEGEAPTVELLQRLRDGILPTDVKNISFKANGEVVHNELRPLADPLGDLPFPDYSIYRNDRVLYTDTYVHVAMARGCPFSCSYCHNSRKRELFAGLGSYVRTHSPDRILDEVEAALANHPWARAVNLATDTLGRDIAWLTDLLTRYHARFDVPYTCLIRPEFISEDLVRLLAETNCHMLAFGIESGSERVRRELLGRTYSDEQIIEAARLLKTHGVRFRTLNVIGFPTETREEMLATLDLNIRIEPDYPWCSIFTPYPVTTLADYAMEHGYLDLSFDFNDVPVSFFSDTLLRGVDRNYIRNLQAVFQTIVLAPSLRRGLEPLLALPHGRFHRMLLSTVYSAVLIRSERRSLRHMLRLGLANRKLFHGTGRARDRRSV